MDNHKDRDLLVVVAFAAWLAALFLVAVLTT